MSTVSHRWAFVRHAGSVTLLFVLLTAVMTWPQVRVFGTDALDDQDVYFNMWRLRWIAHAVATSARSLFDANIFVPEHGVLAYSDAMLVEGAIAAPLLWIGVPPVLVHNLMLLGAIAASGIAAFFLARHLTGSAASAVVAGVVFAFAPYRFAHYAHMELQWAVWSPWAFWALQRTIEARSVKFGLLTGLFLVLQTMSSVYYGVFLFVLIPVVALPQLIPLGGRQLMRAGGALFVGFALASCVSAIYSLPYSDAAVRVGLRTTPEVRSFSAKPGDYRMATPTNVLYGRAEAGSHERQLFPGILPTVLAIVGLLLVRPTIPTLSYLVGLILAFELSLGANGQVYPLLYDHLSVFRGLRAPARASVFVLLFLGVLAAYGTAAMTSAMKIPVRRAIATVVCVLVLLEYRVAALPLVPYPNTAPPLYVLLAKLPRGIVAEFPMPAPRRPPHHDPRFAYMSTFHWLPLVNGYSGFYPPSYLARLNRVARFPDEESVASLRRENVRYIVVHDDGYPEGERLRIVDRLTALGLKRLADFDDGWGSGTVMEMNSQ